MTEEVWVHNDGGRADAGYRGSAGDCVTRAIAIATEQDYQEVYDELTRRMKLRFETCQKRVQKKYKGTARNGVHRDIYEPYLEELGWTWTPTMEVGKGCQVHLKAEELPEGRLIVRVTKHVCAVIDGVIHDTYDCSREGTRCVYGYYSKI